MDGISGVTSRIAEIQALINSLDPAKPAPVVVSRSVSAAIGGGSSSSDPTFASALSQSLAGQTSGGGLISGFAPTSGSATTGSATTSSSLVGSALGATGIGGTTGATGNGGTAAATGLRTPAGVPLELVKYGNGKIPANALSSIGQGSHTMWAPAAESFQKMRAAAARDGVTITATDSYRSYDAQVDVARRKGLYSQGGLAAKPGTSEHGWGLSLDLKLDSKALAWARTHAAEYGFTENVPREPWHWTFTA